MTYLQVQFITGSIAPIYANTYWPDIHPCFSFLLSNLQVAGNDWKTDGIFRGCGSKLDASAAFKLALLKRPTTQAFGVPGLPLVVLAREYEFGRLEQLLEELNERDRKQYRRNLTR